LGGDPSGGRWYNGRAQRGGRGEKTETGMNEITRPLKSHSGGKSAQEKENGNKKKGGREPASGARREQKGKDNEREGAVLCP